MVVAELEAFFSRPVAPTRRIAIGRLRLPDDGHGCSATSAAAMLLGGVVATFAVHMDNDEINELHRLIDDVEHGRAIPQPRLRHRFQIDRVGLKRSTSRLVMNSSGNYRLRLDHTTSTSAQNVLAAIYSASALGEDQRRSVATAMRVGLEWAGESDTDLLALLRGGHWDGRGPVGLFGGDRVDWALNVLDLTELEDVVFSDDRRPGRRDVQRAFRFAVRNAHPDHGAPLEGAAGRIAELDTARRILLD